MTTETKTKPKAGGGGLDQWPPLAHIVDKRDGAVKEGRKALCGAKLMGIELPDAAEVCQKCIRERKRLEGQL